ncbi:MAG: hypothetical protein MHPSP_002921, partial [Paramarteilia canceri]
SLLRRLNINNEFIDMDFDETKERITQEKKYETDSNHIYESIFDNIYEKINYSPLISSNGYKTYQNIENSNENNKMNNRQLDINNSNKGNEINLYEDIFYENSNNSIIETVDGKDDRLMSFPTETENIYESLDFGVQDESARALNYRETNL